MMGVLLGAVVTPGAACGGAQSAAESRGSRDDTSVAQLSWLAGSWSDDHDAEVVSEHWTAPLEGVLYGFGFTYGPDRPIGHEVMRISARDGALRFTAWPEGQARTEFTLSDLGESSATFENPGHDFPKRVRYARDGAVLTASISGDPGQPTAEWRLERREGTVIRDVGLEACLRERELRFDLGECYCSAVAFGETYAIDGGTDVALVVIDHPCDACQSLEATITLPDDPGEIFLFGRRLFARGAGPDCVAGSYPVML
jgi:hypothetical protein